MEPILKDEHKNPEFVEFSNILYVPNCKCLE